ncbi:TNFAIP3-interacting protein 3 [Microcaecilia unicolor]|uniref:TNFAIP3-interacting protein 3-like n=1 Tax=Microcaecilia unicolor TaxID=1415580 RepID=A0A6P7X415_9AMPH|nr:TNFAIP3-interacting protein 3-like [Microcaecilia unicolor]XP_030050347.1 TNFAIP3-interacting protein 3-like [Microcaecilia unicolor]
MYSCTSDVSPFNPVRCNSPKLPRGYLYQSADIDSGIISLNSSTCSSECYESRLDYHCPEKTESLKNEGLRTKWLKSENRRCALAGTLSGAHSALEHQKDCLKKQEKEILSSKEALERLLLKQESLASKVSQLQHEKLDQKPWAWQNTEGEDNQKHRITALEEKVKDIIQKIDNGTLNRKKSTSSSISGSVDGGNDYTIEVKNALQHHIQQLSASLNSTQQEKETLECQLTSLHSELFQAKITAKKLEKDILGLQAELSASRNINENLLLEVTSLRRNIQSLSESKKEMKTENNHLDERIKGLEIERQQLLSQKELLLQSLKTWRRWNTVKAWDQSERHCDKCIVLQNQLEKRKKELRFYKRNHGQRKTEFQDHSSTSQSPREQSARSHKKKREKSCKMGRKFSTENIKHKWAELVRKQVPPKGSEDSRQALNIV